MTKLQTIDVTTASGLRFTTDVAGPENGPLVEKLLAFALGRKLEGYDEIVVDDLMDEIARDGYRMRAVIDGVVTSYPFTHRRIEVQRRLDERN